jgi:uncharacterized protein involved in tolerance to divalent cations
MYKRFHVKGTTSQDVVGIQTAEKAVSLNSMDCFVLVAPTAVYCWQGNGATDAEKESGVKIAELLKVYDYKGEAFCAVVFDFEKRSSSILLACELFTLSPFKIL